MNGRRAKWVKEGRPFTREVPSFNATTYHASTAGYYLEALVIYGALTGDDPRDLGTGECAATALAIAPTLRTALQRVAADELVARQLLPGTHGAAARRQTRAPTGSCP